MCRRAPPSSLGSADELHSCAAKYGACNDVQCAAVDFRSELHGSTKTGCAGNKTCRRWRKNRRHRGRIGISNTFEANSRCGLYIAYTYSSHIVYWIELSWIFPWILCFRFFALGWNSTGSVTRKETKPKRKRRLPGRLTGQKKEAEGPRVDSFLVWSDSGKKFII